MKFYKEKINKNSLFAKIYLFGCTSVKIFLKLLPPSNIFRHRSIQYEELFNDFMYPFYNLEISQKHKYLHAECFNSSDRLKMFIIEQQFQKAN